jgi:hypothetical protein
MGGIQRSWNRHTDSVRVKIPFSDPAQVDYLGYLERRIAREEWKKMVLAAKLDEAISALNAVMEFLDKERKERSVAVQGRPAIEVLRFRAEPLSKVQDEEVATAD